VLAREGSFRVGNRRQAEARYAFARYLARESGDQELSAYALGLESSPASVPATSGAPYPATKWRKGDAIALLDDAEMATRSAPVPASTPGCWSAAPRGTRRALRQRPAAIWRSRLAGSRTGRPVGDGQAMRLRQIRGIRERHLSAGRRNQRWRGWTSARGRGRLRAPTAPLPRPGSAGRRGAGLRRCAAPADLVGQLADRLLEPVQAIGSGR
jgi:hypothetical protein